MHSNRKKTIFISGSAYEYGNLGDEGKDFIRNLTRALLRDNFSIITGFGAGVGNHVVESALQEIYAQPEIQLMDRLRVYPFPAPNGWAGQSELDNLFRKYRSEMISRVGAAIFLFGNKLSDIAVREADGMRIELEIARANGILIIPVGVSGYISAEIWKDIVDHFDVYFNDRNLFDDYNRLGNPDTGQEEWIDAILRIANDQANREVQPDPNNQAGRQNSR